MHRTLFLLLLIGLLVTPFSALALSDESNLSQAGDEEDFGLPAPLLLIVLLVVSVGAAWLLSPRIEVPPPVGATEPEPVRPEPVAEISKPEVEPELIETEKEPEPDDLRIIEGIGPKVSSTLHELGITTFAQVAQSTPERLEQMLRDAGVRIISGAPATWPEQARLAAAGEWDKLEQLQLELKGGRRI